MLQPAFKNPPVQNTPPVTTTDTDRLAVVDDHGNTNRTCEVEDSDPAQHYVNSVDATVGQPIVDRVMARKYELEAVLASLDVQDARERGDLELALSTIGELLTGDLEHVPSVVTRNMNRWLEATKHLGETAVTVSIQ
jgi:hypothetical protein